MCAKPDVVFVKFQSKEAARSFYVKQCNAFHGASHGFVFLRGWDVGLTNITAQEIGDFFHEGRLAGGTPGR